MANLAQRDEYGYLAFLGNDRTLLAWFDDQEGWIWNTESWQAMGALSVLRPLSHVRASADGFRLVTTGDEFSLVDATPLAPPPRAASSTAANERVAGHLAQAGSIPGPLPAAPDCS